MKAALVALLAALAWPAAAAAHVGVDPPRLDPGTTQLLTFTVPNERATPLTGFALERPRELRIEQVETRAGWTASSRGRLLSWRGGPVPAGQLATFAALLTAPEEAGTLIFVGRLSYADGSAQIFRPAVTVGPAPAAASGRDEGARTLGKAALGVGIAALVLALATGFFALYLWLRSAGSE